MAAFIVYMAKVSVCLTLFAVLFRLIMMKDTFFRFTRLTWWIGIVVCCVLPFIQLKTTHKYAWQLPVHLLEKHTVQSGSNFEMNESLPTAISEISIYDTSADEEINIYESDSENTAFSLSWMSIVTIIYFVGVLWMCIRFCLSLLRLRQLIRRYPAKKYEEFQLILCDEHIIPFSFFRWIVLSKNDYRTNSHEIILHEKMHLQKGHSFEALLSELFLIVHWFNPAAWSLCGDLREVHEYEADEGVINSGIDATKYQLLLVKKAVGERRFTSVANSFNQSKIKNRITMMLQKKSTPKAHLKVLALIPAAVIMLAAFTCPANENDMVTFDKTPPNETEKTAVIEYFHSVRQNRDDAFIAYAYFSPNNMFYLMQNNDEFALIKPLEDIKNESLTRTVEEVLTNQLKNSAPTPIKIIVTAQDGMPMHIISDLKSCLRNAYKSFLIEKSIEKDVPISTLRSQFTMQIILEHAQHKPEVLYRQILEKYKQNGKIDVTKISADEKALLFKYFQQMTEEQKAQQHIKTVCLKHPKMNKKLPTANDFEQWKDATKYGVWIDGKKVENTDLNNYSHTDFAHYHVGKLMKNTRKYVSYLYQVDLMTHAYFHDFPAKEYIAFRIYNNTK